MPVGRRQALAASQVVDLGRPRRPPARRAAPRPARRPPPPCGQTVDALDPDRALPGGVDPELAGQVVEPVAHRAAARRSARHQLGEGEGGGDAVLVAHERADARAERLLVAVHEAQVGPVERGTGDPLEPGQRLGVGDAPGGGQPAEHRRRHDRGRHQPVGPARRGASSQSASSTPISSPDSAPPPAGRRSAAGSGHGDRQPVGVGVVGDHDVGARRGPRRRAPGPAPRAPRGWGRRRSGSRGRARPARPRPPAGRTRRRSSTSTSTSRPTPCSGV